MAKIRLASGGTVDMLVTELRGKQVRTRRELRNGLGIIAAGTVCTVSTTWRSGVNLDGPECTCCHVQIHIRRVDRDDVELL